MTRSRILGLVAVVAAIVGAVYLLRPPDTGTSAPASPAAAARNLLLVTIDTLRSDRLGAYGHAAARTPTLDRLAREGTRFNSAFATAPITLTSHASLLSGRYPPGHGARDNGVLMPDAVPTLATVLKQQRFETAAFIAAFPLDRRFGLARGFDHYSDQMPRDAAGRILNERPASQVVDEALAWLGRPHADRTFVWVHVFEPHAPYETPASRPGSSALERYDDEIAVVDREIQRLLNGLGGDEASTLVVVCSDHGEAFGEHGEFGHSVFIYDTTLRVPLIVRGPGIEADRVVTEPVSLIDVAPMALARLGLSPMDSDGVDVLDPSHAAMLTSRELYAETFAPLLEFGWSSLRSVRAGEWKFIAAPRAELYQLSRDPGEQSDRASAETTVAGDLAARVAKYSGPELPEREARRDRESANRLGALGYLSSGGPSIEPSRRPDPKDRRTLAAAIARVTSGEVTGAELIAALEAILREDPSNPQAHLRLGYAIAESGQCDRAEPHFQAAIRAKLPSADPYLGLAACRAMRQDYASAERTLRDAQRVEPGNPIVEANLGNLALAQQRYDAAITAYRSALASEPSLLEARFNLARALALTDRRPEALLEARALLDRLPAQSPQRGEVERLIAALQ